MRYAFLGTHSWQPVKSFNAKFNTKKSLLEYSSLMHTPIVEPLKIEKAPSFAHLEPLRGYFDQTDPNDLAGVDLDVPTFIRKGIRIEHK